MTRRIKAKVGEYQKDGETKGSYVEIGVIMEGNGGEYALIDPAVNLAGVLTKQNLFNHERIKRGEQARIGGMLMCSIFDDDYQRQGQGGGQQYGQQPQQQGNTQANAYRQATGGAPAPAPPMTDDDIPF